MSRKRVLARLNHPEVNANSRSRARYSYLAYMAPEQLRADLGERPVRDWCDGLRSPHRRCPVRKHIPQRLLSMREARLLQAVKPEPLREVLLKCLAPDPRDRFPSAAALKASPPTSSAKAHRLNEPNPLPFAKEPVNSAEQ